jgi:hypothetical protein
MNFKNYVKAFLRYNGSKFRESYTPPAARIRVKCSDMPIGLRSDMYYVYCNFTGRMYT